MNRLPLCTAIILIAVGTGCEVNRAAPADVRTVQTLSPEAAVDVPGPYSIAADGSVDYRSIPRPNGHLLGTRVNNGLPREAVMPWIEETARLMGGDRVYVRSIIGPYLLDPQKPENEKNPMVYDVAIEIWEPRSDEHDHS